MAWPLGAQVLSSCSSELGCDPSATAISCSCVAICSEGRGHLALGGAAAWTAAGLNEGVELELEG
jgi:hypothetical protein